MKKELNLMTPKLVLIGAMKMGEDDFFYIDRCRICGGKGLKSILDLGEMPLSNRVLTESEISQERKFPLKVLLCLSCGLAQLSVVVNPSLLFRNYVYRSSISDSFAHHCGELAEELNVSVLNDGALVLDVASNDGCLLKEFQDKGNRVLGVDPAVNLAAIANSRGIETIPEFWTPDLAKKVLGKYGSAKIITAFNVLAHVHDIHSFVEGVKIALAKNGYFIVESPYMYDLVQGTEFDTIYHEHLSYLLVKPVQKLMKQHELRIAKIRKVDIHGGSIRFYIEHEADTDTSDGSVQSIIEEEQKADLYSPEAYKILADSASRTKRELTILLRDLKRRSARTFAFGASAKGNILLNYCGIGPEMIECILDDTPEKQGKLFPGVHIPILSRDALKQKPDYLLILAWNFMDEILVKTKDYKQGGGKYIVPVPKVGVI
jgi:SAM-dependent methyltransferase